MQSWAYMNGQLRGQLTELETQVQALRQEVLNRHGPGCGCVEAIAYQNYLGRQETAPPPC